MFAGLRRRIPSLVAVGARAARVSATPAALAATSPLQTSATIFAVANGLGLAISLATGSHLHLDVLGTGPFIVSALALQAGDARQLWSGRIIALWAAKLVAFLAYRAQLVRHDARLDDTLNTVSGTIGFWAISFVWGWVVSLPHTLAAAVPLAARPAGLGPASAASLALCVSGLMIETLADWQKWQFKQDPAKRGLNCDVGLWAVSQHPNWAGNIMLWLGLLSLNAPTLMAPAGNVTGRLLAASASPLFLAALFYGQATGNVANAPELAAAKYGRQKGYQAYLEGTPLIFPSPARLLGLVLGSDQGKEL